jgi:hypothetical protein
MEVEDFMGHLRDGSSVGKENHQRHKSKFREFLKGVCTLCHLVLRILLLTVGTRLTLLQAERIFRWSQEPSLLD